MTKTRALTSGHRAALFTTLTAALILGACAAAHASEAAPAVRVSLHGLDLASPAGQEQLLSRLNRAAHKVCAVTDIRDLGAVAAAEACERSAAARAVLTVHGSNLAAVPAATRPRD